MSRNNALVIGFLLVVLAGALSLWAFPHLPESVPSHWDLSGHVNGYSSRFFATALMPVILAFTWLLMVVLPKVSPRGFRLDQFAGAFYVSVLAIIGVLAMLHLTALRAELSNSAPSIALIFIAIGALLAILGNFMGKLRKNFFIGIRTPWTLANDEVWIRTNRLAGQLMVVGGLGLMVCGFFPSFVIGALIAIIVFIVLVPAVYSYVLYNRLVGFGPDRQEG